LVVVMKYVVPLSMPVCSGASNTRPVVVPAVVVMPAPPTDADSWNAVVVGVPMT
jgi:hypothetical protein